jgi:GT2 family glycosyltransferase
MTVSIIIAVKTWQRNLEECVGKCQELDFSDYEILILPDESRGRDSPHSGTVPAATVPLSVFPTGPVCPADKRDIAMKYAKGEVLAFIDDDAYPTKDWLNSALENFKDKDVAAVVGPAITAPEDALRQKASGVIFSSVLVSGRYNYRYLPKKKMTVDDYPSCNFLVRKQIMQELGGFNTKFWPGEDTKLCLDITRKLGRKIIYDPGVLVYHHRRPLFIPHLKQVANYSLHRGYFVKKYPATSLRLPFFIPTLFLCALICGGPLSLISAPLRSIYFSGVFLYLALVLFFSIHKDLRLIPLVFFGTILTHLTYGLYFLKGLFSKKLKEE